MALPNGYQDAAQVSMTPASSGPPEIYIPLWWYSGSYAYTSNYTATSVGTLLSLGTNSTNSNSSSTTKLHTLNSSWNPNNNYAFECALWTTGGATVSAELLDLTMGTWISSSLITSTSTNAQVLRSGTFTLTPNHSYGIGIWTSTSSYNCNIADASLIVFPS